MSPAVKGSRIMASPMRMRTAAADSAMGAETTVAVSGLQWRSFNMSGLLLVSFDVVLCDGLATDRRILHVLSL